MMWVFPVSDAFSLPDFSGFTAICVIVLKIVWPVSLKMFLHIFPLCIGDHPLLLCVSLMTFIFLIMSFCDNGSCSRSRFNE